MAWALLDDDFPNHPKVISAGPVAAFLFVCGLCYCRKYHTDGFIPSSAVKNLGVTTNPKRLVDTLIAVRLWDLVTDGYRVHDYAAMGYDDAATKERSDEQRQKKREAGKKGGQASWKSRSASGNLGVCASKHNEAATKQPASPSAEALRDGTDRSPSFNVLEKKKEKGPRDEWWAELLRQYPANRTRRSYVVQSLFSEIFEADPRPDSEIWAEIAEGLENAVQGYEWRVKGMAPAMDKWLERKGWTERHEYAPVSTVISEKTARNLTAMAQFLRDEK